MTDKIKNKPAFLDWHGLNEEAKSEVKEEKGVRYNPLYSPLMKTTALYEKSGFDSSFDGSSNVDLTFVDKTPGNSYFGVYLKYLDEDHYIFVGYDIKYWFWSYKDGETYNRLQGMEGRAPRDSRQIHLNISLKADGQLNASANNEPIFQMVNIPKTVMDTFKGSTQQYLILKNYDTVQTKIYVKVDDQTGVLPDGLKVSEVKGKQRNDEEVSYEEISSGKLTAVVDSGFPRVKEYQFKDHVLPGQIQKLETIKINGYEVKPNVTFTKEKNKAIYHLLVKEEKHHLHLSFDVVLAIFEEVFSFDIENIQNLNKDVIPGEKIDNEEKLIQTIEFPNNYLVAVPGGKEAVFAGAKMSVNTHKKGDDFIKVNGDMTTFEPTGYMYGFVSNGEVAAGVWSNSQNNYGRGELDYTRLLTSYEKIEEEVYVGIASAPYLYQMSHQQVVNPSYSYELPQSKVIFTEDRNQDGKVDWQDGAIAYREIMNNPVGFEEVPDIVAYRIAMNFGSQSQNPFLKTLDGVKKVALNTENLGQGLLLKGYGNEGHDSGHLNYADIGERMGGLKEFKELLQKGKEYGARMGIHVNVSETYPESKYFSEEILRKNEDGTYSYGWNWLDQAININSAYDLGHGRRQRFTDLYDLVGNDLEFIYVDVWGNEESGDNKAFATHQVAKDIASHGWRLAFEWGYAAEYDSTFQHWAADLTYGGYSLKGINSDIVRFIRNHQKDAWVGNYPDFGGEAVAPLLGGYDMKDFEGWQGRSDYRGYIENLFKVNIPTKFLQHFKVKQWKNGQSVEMNDNGESYHYVPAMEIVLENNQGDEVIVRRKSNDLISPLYKERVIILNGRVIYEDPLYFIPWNWDASGLELEKNQQKWYAYATEEKEVTWDLPKEITGNLYGYELSDLGKINEKAYPIVNHQITLNLKENTPYVFYQKAQENKKIVMNYGEGTPLVDPGFDSKDLSHWQLNGEIEKISIDYSQGYNPMLAFHNQVKEASATQTLKGLKKNTTYAIYVGVDNRSQKEAEAFLKITTPEKRLINSTGKSDAKNYVRADAHNTEKQNATVDDTSYFQNMYLYFTTTDEPEKTTVTLGKTPGSGAAYFDDLRVVENDSRLFGGEHDTNYELSFHQDFEKQVQGIFPFVIGSAEGVEDNRTHLAEYHAPYTQRGWNQKKISDVIDGKWSLKTNGLVKLNALIYRTIPQNYRFLPGKTYHVSFKYEAGSDDAYAFVVGKGEYQESSELQIYPLQNTWEKHDGPQTYELEVTGDPTGTTYIGLYSTKKVGNSKGENGKEVNFRSYNDFVLDNLTITRLR